MSSMMAVVVCVWRSCSRRETLTGFCANLLRSEITLCFVQKGVDTEIDQALTPQTRRPDTDGMRPSNILPRNYSPSIRAVMTDAS